MISGAILRSFTTTRTANPPNYVNNNKRSPPWWDKTCWEKRKNLRKAANKFCKNPSLDNWNTLKKEETDLKILIKAKKYDKWLEFTESINNRTSTGELWSKIKRLQHGFVKQKGKRQSPEIRNQLEEKAINEHSKKPDNIELQCCPDDDVEVPGMQNETTSRLHEPSTRNVPDTWNSDVTQNEMMHSILRSNSKSAPGIDNLDYNIIKNLPAEAKQELLNIFHKIWTSNEDIPQQWKTAKVVFIEKTGKNSVRPIAMTSCVGKICERIVTNRLTDWVENQKLIHESQNGFRKGRGTVDNLASIMSIIRRNKGENTETAVILIDVKAAYDNVDHKTLLRLHSRPILYNIYTRELGLSIEEEECEILQYADDIAIIITCNNIYEAERKTLKVIHTLSDKLKEIHLGISREKTQILYFSKHTNRNKKLSLKMGNSTIEETDNAKFLGIIIDNKLKFNLKVKEIENKAKKRLNMLRYIAHIKKGATPSIMIQLYKSLVRSVLEYAVITYYTPTNKSVERFQKIQNEGIRIAMGYRNSTPTNVMAVESGIMNFEERVNLLAEKYIIKQRAKSTSKVMDHINNQIINYEGTGIPHEEDIVLNKGWMESKLIEDIIWKSDTLEDVKELNALKEINWKDLIDLQSGYVRKHHHISDTVLINMIKEHLGIDEYNPILMYTDGSKKNNSSSNGAGIVTKKDNQWEEEGLSINKIATIYTTECIAISEAIKIAEEKHLKDDEKIIILTDSESVLSGLLNISSDKTINPWIKKIAKQANKFNMNGLKRVLFAWIPAHMGIEGNERADQIAKERTEYEHDEDIKIPISDIINRTKDKKWQNYATEPSILNSGFPQCYSSSTVSCRFSYSPQTFIPCHTFTSIYASS
ncbi:uncharacterized protein LOC143219708 [Lasioglossum baleicum]|uniref:uncharacterized protein LOC143219708 n=1 Tax=Lasioglossum baleicum TaxID=434251 RepID=UPI003FCD7E61